MPKAKRRKNIFGFGRKSSGNYIPASGGIAKHAPKHRAKASGASDSKYDDVAKSLAGKPYKSLSTSQQATVRGIASKMNPKRRKNIFGFGSMEKQEYKGHKYKRTKKQYHGHWIYKWGPGDYGTSFSTDEYKSLAEAKRDLDARAGKRRNPELSLPKNQFVNAKVRMKGGKIQVMADERILGKAGFKAGAGLSGVSVSGGAKLNPKRTMKVYELYWSPTGQKIATVEASTSKAAKSKAPAQYRKYRGEIYTKEIGLAQNPTTRTYKTKGRPEKLKTLMERRKSRAKAGRWGTKKSERYLVGTPYLSTSDRVNASTVTAAKKKGKTLAKKSGDGVFWIQNQVTGSITNYKVS